MNGIYVLDQTTKILHVNNVKKRKVGDKDQTYPGLIHTNVCGPMSVTARDGYRHFITFIDDLSRYEYIFLMKHKSESFDKFKEFQNKVENQLERKIQTLRSDRADEYLSTKF